MIYIVNAAGTDDYKVGYTKNRPDARLKELQTGNNERLRVVHIFEGSLEEETILHNTFQRYNTHGEWFKLDVAALFEIIVNFTLGQRIEPGKELVDFRDFLANFAISRAKPKDLHYSLHSAEVYRLYLMFCRYSSWTPKPEKYFRSEMRKKCPAGEIKRGEGVFYNMFLKTDSILTREEI